MGAPRLVEYREQDPCMVEPPWERDRPMCDVSAAPTSKSAGAVDEDYGVKVEARFEVGEYQVVILSAAEPPASIAGCATRSTGSRGAEPPCAPYVESGMKFFVAKVDPKKVTFEDGMATLSPLRFHYDSEEFALPVRLGLANSAGTQDPHRQHPRPGQRYEVANFKNVTIPTNLDVTDEVRPGSASSTPPCSIARHRAEPGRRGDRVRLGRLDPRSVPGAQLDWGLRDPGADGGRGRRRLRPHPAARPLRRGPARRGAVFNGPRRPPSSAGREACATSGKQARGARPPGQRQQLPGLLRDPPRVDRPHHVPMGSEARAMGRPAVGRRGRARRRRAGRDHDLAFAPRGQVQLLMLVRQDVPRSGSPPGCRCRRPARARAAAAAGTGGGAAEGWRRWGWPGWWACW
ncbi:MAG: DUF2330 domain-containing protein [Kofleriaceae bacterium]|nr:DUF2330 domain-containing protein [Kofleriaceae bacterium]